MCSGVQVSGSSAAGGPRTDYKLFVPQGGGFSVTVTVDVLKKNSGNSFLSWFHVDPVNDWMFGTDALKPTFDDTHTGGLATLDRRATSP